jgi:hypothetical protein
MIIKLQKSWEASKVKSLGFHGSFHAKAQRTQRNARSHNQLCELCALAALREILLAPLREIKYKKDQQKPVLLSFSSYRIR